MKVKMSRVDLPTHWVFRKVDWWNFLLSINWDLVLGYWRLLASAKNHFWLLNCTLIITAWKMIRFLPSKPVRKVMMVNEMIGGKFSNISQTEFQLNVFIRKVFENCWNFSQQFPGTLQSKYLADLDSCIVGGDLPPPPPSLNLFRIEMFKCWKHKIIFSH